jgi:hypothetical protein
MTIVYGAVQVVLLVGAAIGYGGIAGRPICRGKSLIEQLFIRFTLGLGLIIFVTMTAGWLGLWGRWFHHGVLAIGVFLSAWRPPRTVRLNDPLFQRRDWLWAAPVLLVFFFYSSLPPTFYDALLYHLGVPGYYLQLGRFAPWPENFFSAFPQNAEMLNLLLLSGGSVHGPKFLSLAAAIMLFLFLADWAGREGKAQHNWLPGLIFFSIPEVIFLAATEKNDILLMLFLLPGVRLLAGLKENPKGWTECIYSGVFLGLAVGVKWQGLLYGTAFVLAYFLKSRAPWRKRFWQIILIGCIVILMIFPWLLKNQVMFGNPFHPYLTTIFPTANWSGEQTRQIGEGIRRGQGLNPFALLTFCLQMFLFPYRFGLTHITGIIMLLLIPLLFFGSKKAIDNFLLTGCGIGLLLMLLAARVPRYFLPIFMVLALPMAAAWEKLEQRFPRYRRIAFLLLFSLVLIQAAQAVSLLERMTLGANYTWKKLRGELPEKAQYLNIIPYYPAIEFINKSLPVQARIAFLGEDRTFYMERQFLASSSFDRNPVLSDFLASRDAEDWGKRLHLRGITHLLYTPQGLARMQKISCTYRHSRIQQQSLETAFKAWQPLFTDGRYFLYRVDW